MKTAYSAYMGSDDALEHRIRSLLAIPTTRRGFVKAAAPLVLPYIYNACSPMEPQVGPNLDLKVNGADSAEIIGEGTATIAGRATPGYKSASVSTVDLRDRDGSWQDSATPTPDFSVARQLQNDTNSDITHIVDGIANQSDGMKSATKSVTIIVKPYNRMAGTAYTIQFSNGNFVLAPLPNAAITTGGATAVTDADGKYSLKGTKAIEDIVGSAANHQQYTTYLRHYPDQTNQRIVLIPNEYIEIVNDADRRGQGPINGTGPSKGLSRLDTSINWKYVIYTGVYTKDGQSYQFSDVSKQMIRDAARNYMSVLTRGKIKNPTDADFIERDGELPPDSFWGKEGEISFQPKDSSGGPVYVPNNDFIIKGAAIRLREIVGKAPGVHPTILFHELIHGLGVHGHPKEGVDSIMAWSTQKTSPTATDIGLILATIYNGWRPLGSLPPDNDPR